MAGIALGALGPPLWNSREKTKNDLMLPMILQRLRSFLPVYAHLSLRVPKILFLMPLSYPGRAMIRSFAATTGWKNPADKIENHATCGRLEEIIGQQGVRILFPTAEFGDVSTYELYVLNSLVKALRPKNIFEIGTLHGRTTVNLLDNADELETLYTLDIMEDLPGNRFAGHPRSAKVKRIVCDSRDLDVRPYRNMMDLIFIDADHTYDAVLGDSAKALEMLSAKGAIAWHDYTSVSDTKRACHEFMRQNPGRRYVHVKDTSLLVMLAD